MNSVLGVAVLSIRRWREAWKAHAAVIVLTAAIICAFVLFTGYLNALGRDVSGRIRPVDLAAGMLMEAPPGTELPAPFSNAYGAYYWRIMQAATSAGVQVIAAVEHAPMASILPEPKAGEVWLPETLGAESGLEIGDAFHLSFHQGGRYYDLSGTVVGFYEAMDEYNPLLVSADWLQEQGLAIGGRLRGLISPRPGRESLLANEVRNSMRSARIIEASFVMVQAKQLVSGVFSSGIGAAILLFILLTLGMGTISMLTFLDSKRELSVLKSLGLRPVEVGTLYLAENGLTAILGSLLGIGAALVLQGKSPLPIDITTSGVTQGLFLTGSAFALGLYPTWTLARIGTVNELMLDRPIPLVRRDITGLTRRLPSLDDWLSRGYACLKLQADYDCGFQGILFRQEQDKVKAGEIVAWESVAWGLGERRYVTPCDGQVVKCNREQGLIVIKPKIMASQED